MNNFGAEQGRISPYLDELTKAKCIKRLANFVSGMQTCFDDQYDTEAMDRLLADVAAVRQEFDATPDDIQLALQANENQLLLGALPFDEES